MILLKSLQLNNFLSHKNTLINFDADSRILIDGKSGAGKSSVVEAISWAIFNKGRVSNRSLIKRGAPECSVELELEEDGPEPKLWKIIRKVSSKGTHTVHLTCNGKPATIAGTKNIQEYIEKELLKCSYTLFTNSVCYPQENLESFVRQTPANRKDIILELVRAGQYDEYYEKTKTSAQEFRAKWQVADMSIDRLQNEQENNQSIAASLDNILVEENKTRVALDTKITELDKLKELFSTQRSTATQIDSLENDLARLRGEMSRMTTSRKQYQDKITELDNVKKDDVVAKFNEHKSLTEQLEQYNEWERSSSQHRANAPSLPNYRTLIPPLEKEIAAAELRVSETPTEECKNCGCVVPCSLIGKERQQHLDNRKIALADYKTKQVEYDTAEAAWKVEADKILAAKPPGDVREIKVRITFLQPSVELYYKLETQTELKNTYLQEVASLDKLIEEVTVRGKELKTHQDNLKLQLDSAIEAAKDRLSLEVAAMARQVDDLTYRRGQAMAASARNEDITKDLEKLSNEKLDYTSKGEGLNLLKDAFGPNGVKAIVVDYVIPQLEDRMNGILSQLSNFKIHLNTQKSSAGGDSTIEGLFISIINDQGEEFDYDSYSGGQKTKINFAIAEGLAELQKMNFRILDEAVIGLDEETGKQFAETIMALQHRFSQMVCVSHVREIKELFNQTLVCVNINGDSEIE